MTDPFQLAIRRLESFGQENRQSLLYWLLRQRQRAMANPKIRDALFVATAPIIYAGIVPFVMLDVFITLYQHICFPVYDIPKVRRADYISLDRFKLKYLTILERINCAYCGYGNGVIAYAREVASRTEQRWCPIRHRMAIRDPHRRYGQFMAYGDTEAAKAWRHARQCPNPCKD